jgi:uncharacterized protein (TIGR02453 family)
MREVIDFLRELRENNNRDWFEANKPRYREVQATIGDFAARLIGGIASFDPSVRGLEVKDTTYRIYRDTRFSNDKTPYKHHVGVYVCPGGKKSGNAGYYFHIEPEGEGMMGGNFLTSGLYLPEPAVLKSVREEIAEDGERFLAALKKAKGFALALESSLKRMPQGYPVDHPMGEYLKLRDIYVQKQVGEDYLLSPDLLKNVVEDFRKTYALSSLLNRCADYAREEM